MGKIKKNVKIYSSFEEENKAEYQRRRQMSCEDRWKEFAVLQDRRWGKGWRSKPIEKVVSIEKIQEY